MRVYTYNIKVYNPKDNDKFISFDVKVLASNENQAQRIAYNEAVECIDTELLYYENIEGEYNNA